jgi:cobalamin synthase
MVPLFFPTKEVEVNEQEAMAGFPGLVVLLIGIVVAVFFLLTLYRALSEVRPENRRMNPALVWLNLIPLVNLVWIFVTVIQLAESLVKEGRDRSANVGDGGKRMGLLFAVLAVLSLAPVIGFAMGLIALMMMIIYWARISGFLTALKKSV